MKRTFSTLSALLSVSVIALAGLLSGCAEPTPTAMEGDARAAIMPDANLVIYYDAASIRGAAIGEAFEGLGDNAGQLGADMQTQDLAQLQEQFKEITGLENEDFSSFLMAMNLENIDFDAPEPPAFNELEMTLAVTLRQAVTGEQLVEFIRLAASEQGEEPEISESTHNGTTIYTVADADMDMEVEEGISFAMIGDNKVGLMGPKAALQDAIDRAASGQMAQLSPNMRALERNIEAGTQAYALFTMTEDMKQAIQEAPEASPNDPMAGLQSVLPALEGASLGMRAGDTADLTLRCVFADNENAEKMTAFLENTVISTIRMFAGFMIGERPLPMLQNMEAAQENNHAYMRVVISADDIQSLRELLEQEMGGMQF